MSRETFAYQSSDATSFSRHHHGEMRRRRTVTNKWLYGGVSQFILVNGTYIFFRLTEWLAIVLISKQDMSNLRWGQDPMSHAETDLDILFILCPAIIISFYIPSISKLFSFFIANSFPILRVQIALHVIYFHFYCFSSARFPLFLFLFYECCKFSSTQKEKK